MKEACFRLNSQFKPAGDQPIAIEGLVQGVLNGNKDQVLLGITGSGKTFTMASVIEKLQRPAIIMAHNKTLAGQLYNEMKSFFPDNAVEYFISYYDYYQPEAYISTTDTYIEKNSIINDKIDQLRQSATKSVLERKDTIIIASVSAIYGLGEPDQYSSLKINLKPGMQLDFSSFILKLSHLQYSRNDIALQRGTFMIKGDTIYIYPPSSEEIVIRIELFGEEIEAIYEFNIISGEKINSLDEVAIFPNGHFVAPEGRLKEIIPLIEEELEHRIAYFNAINAQIEAQRIKQRVKYDIEMMQETGICKGIENYSRYITGRKPGSPPPTLFEYLPKDALLFVDESHVTLPQIKAMFNGDLSRKSSLVNFGFRLPSALDNRPLKFEEWDKIRQNTIFVSATPGKIELEKTGNNFVEQIIRPTGLLDPICEIKSTENQIYETMKEILEFKKKNLRSICITVTKKNAERLCDFLVQNGINAQYLHSDIEVLERVEIIQNLRKGKIDVIIGINLLREGIDIPECAFVGILDADKEGFLRSETALIQIIGRAARNTEGKVTLFADRITDSMKKALEETERRRNIQIKFNEENGITPRTTINAKNNIFDEIFSEEIDSDIKHYEQMTKEQVKKELEKLKKTMKKAAEKLDFNTASQIKELAIRIEKRFL